MEPLRFVQWQKLDLGTNDPENIATHGQQNHCTIHTQHETSTSRHPYRERKGVQTCQPDVILLFLPAMCLSSAPTIATVDLPSQGEEANVESPEEHIEHKLGARHLMLQPLQAWHLRTHVCVLYVRCRPATTAM